MLSIRPFFLKVKGTFYFGRLLSHEVDLCAYDVCEKSYIGKLIALLCLVALADGVCEKSYVGKPFALQGFVNVRR